MSDKVQTGLRIPEKRYNELVSISEDVGVSVNSLILMLIDIGLILQKGQIILQEKFE